jgi:hypothetical protein
MESQNESDDQNRSLVLFLPHRLILAPWCIERLAIISPVEAEDLTFLLAVKRCKGTSTQIKYRNKPRKEIYPFYTLAAKNQTPRTNRTREAG